MFNFFEEFREISVLSVWTAQIFLSWYLIKGSVLQQFFIISESEWKLYNKIRVT